MEYIQTNRIIERELRARANTVMRCERVLVCASGAFPTVAAGVWTSSRGGCGVLRMVGYDGSNGKWALLCEFDDARKPKRAEGHLDLMIRYFCEEIGEPEFSVQLVGVDFPSGSCQLSKKRGGRM